MCQDTAALFCRDIKGGNPSYLDNDSPSIYSGSDGRRESDVSEVTVAMRRDVHGDVHEVMREAQILCPSAGSDPGF